MLFFFFFAIGAERSDGWIRCSTGWHGRLASPLNPREPNRGNRYCARGTLITTLCNALLAKTCILL